MDSPNRIFLIDRLVFPLIHRLMLYRNAGGVADEAIGIVQLGPGSGNSRTVGPGVVLLQTSAQLIIFVHGSYRYRSRQRVATRVAYPVHIRFQAASAGHEVQGTIGSNHAIGQG